MLYLAVAGSVQVHACSFTVTPVNATCNGANDGAIYAWATSGTPPYQYSIGGTYQSSGTFTGLTPGSYTVYFKDALGCTSQSNVNISQPSAISISAVPTTVSCNGGNDGRVTISASGGTPSYIYSIGGGYQGSNVFTGLSAGTYTVTVMDASGCTNHVNVNVTQPSAISVSASPYGTTCNGGSDGSITISASGGTPSYIYSIGGSFQGSNSFTGLSAGTYTVTVIDVNGCSNQVNVNVTQPSAISYSSTIVNESATGAYDGSASLSVSGGTPSYIYSWSPGGGTSSSVTGLTAGTYQCLITDAAGCSTTANITINVGRSLMFQPSALAETPSLQLSLYPNPAKDNLYLHYLSQETSDVTITLHNSLGETIYNKTVSASQVDRTLIDVSGFPAGMYTLNLLHNQQHSGKTFFIQR